MIKIQIGLAWGDFTNPYNIIIESDVLTIEEKESFKLKISKLLKENSEKLD